LIFRYDIINFQAIEDVFGNVSYKYVVVGSWETGHLTIDDDNIYWPRTGKGKPMSSVCSEPCKKGFVKVGISWSMFAQNYIYPRHFSLVPVTN